MTIVVLALLVLPGIAPVIGNGDAAAIAVVAPGDNNGNKDKPDKDKPEKPPKPDKDKDKDKDKDSNDKGKRIDPPQSATESYSVEVRCDYDDASDHSTCVATGMTPEGAAPIADLLIDADGVCAPVVGGMYLITPPTEGSEIDGYGVLGDATQVVLVFEGQVTVGSSATFWLSIEGSWIPAAGPGLVCASSASAGSTPEAASTPATGSLVVTLYSCPAPPTDASEPDWFGTCQVMDSTLAPELVNVATGEDVTALGEATGAGQTTWGGIEPGTYDVSVADATWCHGESDKVDGESNLIVEGGATTSVWLFFCPEPRS
jgi:hypothetical protein